LPIRGQLGNKLIMTDSNRSRQPQAAFYFSLHRCPYFQRAAKQFKRSGYVHKCLVQGNRFHQRSITSQYGHQLLRDQAIFSVVRRQKNKIGTKPQGRGRGHGRMDAIFPGLVRCRGDYPPLLGLSSHSQGNFFKRGVISLLHRCKKSIHVHMHYT